ncbi:hypothetical protein [Celeribacter sp.]|uniref:hypothetical protein n=1 Tax=Celeribacter sp. TaxID=1890673 RepID=UPI003A8CEC7A
MTFLVTAIALAIFALPMLRDVPQRGQIQAVGFDGLGVLIGFGITCLVAAVTSPMMGFGFVLAVIVHETGGALACRIAGQDVARLRLVPLPFIAPPRSDRAFTTALEESFVALYGPALAIVPMVLAFGLFHAFAATAPAFADLMRATAIMLGAFNFIMLLPFLPFAGGRVMRAVSEAFWPNLGVLVTAFMTAAFLAAALRDGSIAMFVLSAAGAQSLLHKKRSEQVVLSPNEALLVMATYGFALTAHFTGGWWLIGSLM